MARQSQCATDKDTKKKFNGEVFTLAYSSSNKKEMESYISDYGTSLKKSKIKYRTVKKGSCNLLYTKHPKKSK